MDLRSRRNDAGVRTRTLLTPKRGHLLAGAVGIVIAIAACGPAATGVQGTNAGTPGSATANGTSGAGTHAAGSTSTGAAGASHGSAGAGGPRGGTASHVESGIHNAGRDSNSGIDLDPESHRHAAAHSGPDPWTDTTARNPQQVSLALCEHQHLEHAHRPQRCVRARAYRRANATDADR